MWKSCGIKSKNPKDNEVCNIHSLDRLIYVSNGWERWDYWNGPVNLWFIDQEGIERGRKGKSRF